MTPTLGSLVRASNGTDGSVGVIAGTTPNDHQQVLVRWRDGKQTTHHLSSLTSALREGTEVTHVPSHEGMEALGHGTVLQTRQLNGQVQHLVDFWDRQERRWLPWQRLRLEKSVREAFRSLPTKPGDSESLRLRNLAYALSEWNLNTGGLSRLEIDPLPHQLYLVNRILASGDLNWMIADDVGLGKTIEVGLLLAALRQRKLKRFLIVVPAGLTRQWEEELRDKFFLDDFVIYGETANPQTAAQWRLYDRVIVSMDRAKHENHLPNILLAEEWDLVVVDEAHRLTRHEYGLKTEATQRYAMAQALRKRTDAMLLLTGTPHQGKDDQFRGILELLRPGQEWKQRFKTIKKNPEVLSSLIIRNRKADVTDEHGNFIFRGKTTKTVAIHGSDAETQFETALVKYFQAGYAAGASRGQQGIAIGFVMTTFRKLAASSLAAISNALDRRAHRLRGELMSLERTAPKSNHGVETDERFVEQDEEAVGGEAEFFKGELAAVEQLAVTAKTLAQVDSKVTGFFDVVLPEILATDVKRKVLIFTEYRTTQAVIAEGLERRYGPGSYQLIHGGQDMALRRQAVDAFNEDCQFLVSTEAGGEGLNLQRRCNVMVNFDLPWNPMRLVQRVGRLYRYGQKERVVVFNMKGAQGMDQEILGGMYARLERVAADLAPVTGEHKDGLVEDILGQLVGALDVKDVLEAAIHTTEDRSEERIREAIERAQRAAKAQEDLLRHAAGFDPEAMEGRVQLTVEHIKAFAEATFAAAGIEIANKLHRDDIWELKLPEAWQKSLARRQNIRIAFDRSKATAHKGELFDGDHPLLNAMLDKAKSDPLGKAAVVKLTGARLGYSAIVRWLDESGRKVDTEYVALLKHDDGSWSTNHESWLEWLLRPSSGGVDAVGPTPEELTKVRELLLDYTRRFGPKGAMPDEYYPISGVALG